MSIPSKEQMATALAAAEALRSQGGDDNHLGRVLLYLHRRDQVLERLLEAVEHYLNSGHGPHEHTRLIKAVDAARHQTWEEAAEQPVGGTFGL
jgi:hypothetical protein